MLQGVSLHIDPISHEFQLFYIPFAFAFAFPTFGETRFVTTGTGQKCYNNQRGTQTMEIPATTLIRANSANYWLPGFENVHASNQSYRFV